MVTACRCDHWLQSAIAGAGGAREHCQMLEDRRASPQRRRGQRGSRSGASGGMANPIRGCRSRSSCRRTAVFANSAPLNIDAAPDGLGRESGAPIRGRGPELAVLDKVITAVAAGRGGVLIFEGPPGIGKSRLLAEARMRAEDHGVRTLISHGSENQQSAPFYS